MCVHFRRTKWWLLCDFCSRQRSRPRTKGSDPLMCDYHDGVSLTQPHTGGGVWPSDPWITRSDVYLLIPSFVNDIHHRCRAGKACVCICVFASVCVLVCVCLCVWVWDPISSLQCVSHQCRILQLDMTLFFQLPLCWSLLACWFLYVWIRKPVLMLALQLKNSPFFSHCCICSLSENHISKTNS